MRNANSSVIVAAITKPNRDPSSRGPHLFVRAEVLLEVQRLAGARQVLELTLRYHLPDMLRDVAEGHRDIARLSS